MRGSRVLACSARVRRRSRSDGGASRTQSPTSTLNRAAAPAAGRPGAQMTVAARTIPSAPAREHPPLMGRLMGLEYPSRAAIEGDESMSPRHCMILLVGLAAGPIGPASAFESAPKTLVVCAPGY